MKVGTTTYCDLPEFRGLKEIEQRFVMELVSDPKRNGTDAAIRAGYEAGAGKASAAVAASRLLKKDKILNAMRALEAKVRSEADLLPRMVAALSAIAFSNLNDVIRWDGKGRISLIPSHELSPTAAASLASIQDVVEERQGRLPGLDDDDDVAMTIIKRNVKQHDKLRALELLARITGVGSPERLEVTGDLLARIERARGLGGG